MQGGSSITQQLAKNLFLSNERTIERKVKEAFLAVWLEVRLSKNEILKLYLDRAYLGGGTFGVDAAAQYYFNKSAREVNLSEAAMLAGLFKAPSKFAPHINLPAARARANVVLDNLVEAGFMTEGQVFGARRNPANAIDRRDERAPNYYLDWAFDEMKKLANTLPKTVHDRVFVARLALDVNLQRNAERAVEDNLRQHGRDYKAKQAAAVLMEHDGAVRAMVGGRDYGESQFNRATDALRQPGSSFKPYVYAAALQSGALQAELGRGRLTGLYRQLVSEELFRGLFRLDDIDGRAAAFDQRRPGQAVDRARQRQSQERTRQDPRRRTQGGTAHAIDRHAIDADRRQRGHGARSYRRIRHVRQRRQVGHSARDPGGAHRHRRPDLAFRPRRQEARAGDQPGGRQ